MKILHVTGSMNPESGGLSQGIRSMIPELVVLGFSSHVVCTDEPGETFLLNDTFPIHALGPGRTAWSYSPLLIPWLKKHLTEFDIVILHGLWLYPGYATFKWWSILKKRAKPGSNIPGLFVMPHGMLDPYFQKAEGRKLKAIRNWFYWKVLEGNVVNNSDGILFTCAEELELARKSFRPYHPKQEHNVGFGISTPPVFSPAMQQAFLKKCPEIAGRPYFLYLSRIHNKKGVEILLQVYDWLFQDNPIIPKLVIAGPGMDSSYGKIIQQMVIDKPYLKDSVFFPGMLTGDVKWGAFYGCEAFVLPSHQENFGIAVVEALACAKPVIISDKVNIWREISSGDAGMVASDTFAGIAKIWKNFLDLEPGLIEEMGEKAKITFDKKFAIRETVRRLSETIGPNLVHQKN